MSRNWEKLYNEDPTTRVLGTQGVYRVSQSGNIQSAAPWNEISEGDYWALRHDYGISGDELTPLAYQAAERERLARQRALEIALEEPEQTGGIFTRPTVTTNNWAGRDELLKELNDIDTYSGYITDPEEGIRSEQRRREILKLLEEGDLAAGNGNRSYGEVDRARNIFTGASKDYGSGVTNFLGTASRALNALADKIPDSGIEAYDVMASPLAETNTREYGMKRADQLQAAADRLGEGAQKDLESAKFGLSKLGQAGVDIATNMIQMGFDAGLGAVTGGGALAPMFVRSSGSSAREARLDGASLGQQVAYGTVKGGIEVLTEKLLNNTIITKIYGADAAGKLVERTIGKLAKSDLGRSLLRFAAGAAGEGMEEIIADLASPFAEIIYKDESLGQLYSQLDPAEILYDGLIGAAIGALGGAGNFIGGSQSENARANAELRAAEAGMTVRGNVDNALDVLSGRSTPEQVQAREQAAMERLGITPQQAQESMASVSTAPAVRSYLDDAFADTGLNEDQMDVLKSGFAVSGMSAEDYVSTVREAFGMGRLGVALDKAQTDSARVKASGNAALTQEQAQSKAYQDAWQLGRQKRLYTSNVEAGSVQDTLDARMSALGEQRQAAMAVYEQGQNPEEFAVEMVRAVQMASYGENIEDIARNDRDTRSAQLDILTPAQVRAAKTIGADLKTARAAKAQESAKNFETIREEAQRVLDMENPEIRELSAAIKDAREYLKQKDAEMQEASAALTAVAGDAITVSPQADNVIQFPKGARAPQGAAYQQALARVQQLAEEIQYTQQAIEQMTQERDEARKKSPGKRKAGTVTFGVVNRNGEATRAIDEKRLNHRQRNIVDATRKLADAVNLDFVFYYGEKGSATRYEGGEYVSGSDTIYININAGIGTIRKYIGMAAISHEMTHFIQSNAPAEYQVLKDYVIEKIMQKSPEEFNRLVRQYQRTSEYQGQTFDAIADEMVANACQTMLQNSEAIREFASENLTIAEKLNNVIRSFVEKIKAAFAEVDPSDDFQLYKEMQLLAGEMDEIQRRWDAALRVAMRNYNAKNVVREAIAETEKAAQTSGEVQVQEYSYEGLPDDAFYKGGKIYDYDFLVAQPDMPVSTMPNLGKGKAWTDIERDDAINHGIANASKVGRKVSDTVSMVENRYTGREIQVAKSGIEHSLGKKTDRRYKTNARIVAVAGDVVKNGIPINGLVPTKDSKQIKGTYALATLLNGGENFFVAISTINQVSGSVEGIDAIDVTHAINGRMKKDGHAVSSTLGSTPITSISTISIADFLDIVNETHRSILSDDVLNHYGEERPADGYYTGTVLFQTMGEDSTGRQLTEAQQEFFADSAITDNQGRLKLMYRGGNGDFTVFDRKKSRPSNLYGTGFYFTDSKTHAERYGRARPFYLNIKNPLKAGSRNITDKQLRAFLKAVEADEDYGLENYGYGATVQSVMKSLKGKDDFGILQDINATAIGDFVAAVELFNEINGTNYDGIVADTETVAFRSNQIKDILNLNPTEDADIRFQSMNDDQITFDDFNPKYAGMHPTLRARQIATDELTGKIRDYFGTIDPDSDTWLSPYELDELLNYDRLYDNFYDAGTVYLSLLQESAKLGPRKRTGTIYPMMEGLLQRMPDGGERVLNMSEFMPIDSAVSMEEAAEAFREWYNKRHPSLYYEGYQPGDLFDASHADVEWYEDDQITPEEDRINPSNTQKQRDHLRSLLKGGKLIEPELSQAREMLQRLENPTKGEIFYQSMDEGFDDTAEEGKFREESWANLEAMEAINEEIGQTVTELSRGKKRALGAILDRLRIGLAPEVRRRYTEQRARAWIRDYGSTVSPERITGNLEYLYNYVLRTENPSTAAINEMAREIAQEIVENSLVPIAEDAREDIQQAKRTISGARLVIDARDASNIGGVESLQEFNRRNVGKFSVAQKGGRADTADRVSVDAFYEQLRNSEGIGHLFPEANNPGEMLENIAAIYEMSDERLENPFQFHMGETVMELANKISTSAWWDILPLEQLTTLEQKKVANAKIEDRISELQKDRKLQKKDADALRRVLAETETLTERNLEMEEQIRKLTEEKALSEADADRLRTELRETESDNLNRTKILSEQIKRLVNEKQLSEAEAKRLFNEVSKLTSKLDSAQRRYNRLRARADERVEQAKIEGRARTEEKVAKERAKAAEKIADLKEHHNEMVRNARERREESANVKKYRERVAKKANKLYELLMKNDNQAHVPEVLKQPLADFLTELDFTSKRGLKGGDETRSDMAFGARLQRIQQLLQNQQSYINGDGQVEGDLGGYIDVSQDSLGFLRNTAELIAQAMAGGRTYTINDMSGAELKQLADLLSNLYTAIRNMNYFMANARFESIREAADGDIRYMEELGKAGKLANAAVVRFAGWENGTPYYIMKRFGKGGQSLFDGFARGWEKMAFNAKEIIDFTEKLYTDKEVNDWKNHLHDFTLADGSKIQMTAAQIMELSMLLNRQQARQHIERGGIRIGDIKLKQGELHDTTHYHLTMEDIVKITGALTERQRTVAKAMQQFMAKRGADWGNEISMRRFGYKFYTEGENYYPIKTDSNDRPMSDTDDQTNSMFRLLNLSSSKALNPKASNALIVGNIFDTFADHMSDMAKLNGMGLPVLDAIKWFNFKERVDLANGEYDTRTLQGAMEQAFGKQAQNYFRTLMKDINGVTESGDRGTSLPGKLMSNYKIAAVGANLRVAMLQPTSYVRALTVLKPQYLIGVMPSKAAYQEAVKYSGTAVWKALGYYDTDISRGMRGQIQHDDTLRDKIASASMKAAELGDQLTWSRLWMACKRQAKAEDKGLSGDALMQATADLFRDVIYSSQVMDSTLTRSQIMRGRTNWTKAMSAFMAEPTLSYNILLDAASQYHLDARQHGKAGAWQRNAGAIGKAFTVYVCSAAFSAVMESIADGMRDDDDEEYLDKVLQALLGEKGLLSGNLAQDLTILGKLPYIKNFISNLQGFKSNDMSTAAFDNLLSVYQIWEETLKLRTGALDKPTKVTYYGKMTEWGKVYKTLQAISQLTGVAAANMTRDATAIWNTIMNGRKDEWKIRTYDSNSLSAEKAAAWSEYAESAGISKSQYKKILSEADVDGSVSPTQAEMGDYLTQAIEAGELTEEQAQALWKSQWNKENSTTLDKWREKNAGEPAADTASTKVTPAAKPVQQAGGYDTFKEEAPLYGSEKKQAAYGAWQSSLSDTMTQEEFTRMLQRADTNDDGSINQGEMGPALLAMVQAGAMTYEQAEAIWHSQWNKPRSRTFAKWLNG